MKADSRSLAAALSGLLLLSRASVPAAGVHHFALSPIPSPQFANQAFGVTLTAQDASNNVVSNFNGTANLSAIGGGTGVILGNPAPASSANTGTFTLGYSFTPNTNMTVTAVRSYSGAKVSIWTGAGVLLASQNVTSIPGTWVETPLSAPLPLNAGSTYRVAFYSAGTTYYWRNDGSNNFANGAIIQSYFASGDAFPATSTTAKWFFVDLRYTGGNPVAVSPVVSSVFSNGVWTGGVAVLQPAANVVLRADDGSGHVGASNPFDVGLTNDLSINMVASPNPVPAGANLTYTLTVTNTGPSAATGVTVTNFLPANATFVSVSSSQGTTSQSGGLATGSLGMVPGGATATVTVVVRSTAVGSTLTNFATVSRVEAESYLGNNTASNLTQVTTPAVSIADASCLEGNVGTTNMIFMVTLTAPSAQTITVNYFTADGTGVAGRDYVSTNSTLSFSVGQTNQTFAVTVIGNTLLESNKTFLVSLYNFVSGTPGRSQAVGTILNDDGLPGQVDHFVWNAVPSAQYANVPFSVTLTALDYFNNLVTNFNGPVNFLAMSSSTGLPPGSVVPYFTDNGVTATGPAGPIAQAGFAPLQVTNISVLDLNNCRVLFLNEFNNFGVTSALSQRLADIRVWVTNGGCLIVHDRSTGNIIPNPFLLGTTGITPARFTTADVDVIPPGSNLAVAGPFGTVNSSTLDGGNTSAQGYVAQNQLPLFATPILSIGGYPRQVVAFSYPLGLGQVYYASIGLDYYLAGGDGQGEVIAAALQNVYAPNVLTYVSSLWTGQVPAAIAPGNSGSFVNGMWTGALTVLQPATNAVLRADDGNGHSGASNPFNVGLLNDLSLTMAASSSPVSAGANLTYTLTVSNTGPSSATGVVVTNILPVGATFLSVASSQGTCSQSGGLVTGSLGVVPGGANATIAIVVTPTVAGSTLTNVARVSRAETDGYPGNNTATNLTQVTTPVISIADSACLEGNVGTTNLIFTVTLAVPSAQTITVNYATADGTAAFAGRDYTSTNGVVTFPAGMTNQTLAVAVIGNSIVESNKTFFVDLSVPVNGALGRSRATGTILNDDGLPGQVDHFVWNTVPSPQYANVPFGITLTALDYSNQVVSNFNGKVNLLAVAGPPGLPPGSVVPYYVDGLPNLTGLSASIVQAGFTPLEVLDINGLNLNNYRVLFVDVNNISSITPALTARLAAIQAWVTNGGCLIVHAWSDRNITTNPLLLGATGITTVFYVASDVDVIPPGTNLVVAGPFGTINDTTLDGGNGSALGYVLQYQLPPLAASFLSISGNPAKLVSFAYPLGLGQVYYCTIPLVDYLDGGQGGATLNFAMQHIYAPNVLAYGSSFSLARAPVQMAPTNSGNFVNGVWAGSITVQQPATNVALHADDANGHTGISSPFGVGLTNDLFITIAASPNPVSTGANLTYTLTVTNTGPSGATGVTITNIVPAGAAFVSVTSSQGTTSQSGGLVTGNLGMVPGGATATVTLVVTPTIAGNTLSNVATVSRAGTDGYQGNNTATNLTQVTPPAISIADASCLEGNVGTSNMLFTVTLAAPSAQTITMNYTTVDGTAIAGRDYLSTNGVVTVPAGETNHTLAVAVIGNTAAESNKTLFLNLSNPTNGSLGRGQATGTILNDDGIPGQVDHFVWNAVPSPQYANVPFSATVTAQDYFNNVVSNFNGLAMLSASVDGGATNTILGNLLYSSAGNSGTFTFGYSFTPSTNLTVTHVRSYSGTKVSIWTDAGVLLTNQYVTNIAGTWVETPLAAPLQLNAGNTYRVTFYSAGTTYYWRDDVTNSFANGTDTQSYYTSGDGFPTSFSNPHWWFVDLRYAVGFSVALPAAPTASGAFSNGVWTGSITVQQPATNVALHADDANGHTGISSPFGVGLTNDLSITIAASPNPVSTGANLTYTLTVTNTGPSGATGVTITNIVPSGATFVSVTSSQGTTSQSGGLVTGNLGVIPGGATATVTLVVTPTIAGNTISNVATVSRAETDGYQGNNAATNLTQVTPPAISIADASCLEGNVGTSNMLFTVTLAAPSAQTITVNYATTDGTALVGRDYFSPNNVVTIPAGVTNQALPIAVIGNRTVESNKTFLVNLTNPVNGTLGRGQATGTILNDDGIPGQVDHFAWNAVPSPQYANVPFSATVTALDYFNNVVSNFNRPVSLSALDSSLGMLPGGAVPFFSDNNVSATGPALPITEAGFTPLQVTDISGLNLNNYHVLFLDETTALSSTLSSRLAEIQSWVTNGGCLIVHDRGIGYINPNPFLLGTTGISSAQWYASDIDVIPPGTNLVTAGPFGTINNTTLDGGNYSAHGYVAQTQLPPSSASFLSLGGNSSAVVAFSYPLGLGQVYYSGIPLDYFLSGGGGEGNVIAAALQHVYTPNVLAYVSSVSMSQARVPMTPANSGNFMNGVWTGSITVQQPATNLVLYADDGNGHTRISSAFTVIAPPVIQTQPAGQDVIGGTNVTFTVSVTGTLPLTYLWQENGSPLPGATNPSFTLTNVVRSNSGIYNVVITNIAGGTNSSNATLTVHVPQVLGRPMLLPNGTLTLTSSDFGGGTITAGDLASFTVQTCTNLTNWIDLPGALTLTNGTLQLHVPGATNLPVRFYRIIENW